MDDPLGCRYGYYRFTECDEINASGVLEPGSLVKGLLEGYAVVQLG